MRTYFFTIVVFLAQACIGKSFAQSAFEWPDSPSATVYQDFLSSYNEGNPKKVRAFVNAHYEKLNHQETEEIVEYWMDIFHRFGKAKPHSLSINKPFDLEVWLQGTISKVWFAPEFILNKNSNKVKTVGMLLGSQPNNTISSSSSIKQFNARVEEYLRINENAKLFQGAVLIIHKGRIIHDKAYGLQNIARGAPNAISTRFNIASITKSITAIAILQLAQKGLLDLYAPITKYLPELPRNISEKITTYQLLTHTSGYKLKRLKGFREEIATTSSLEEVYQVHLKYLKNWDGLSTKKRYNYSNQGYDLLGILVEKVSGLTFQNYLKQHIFIPAKMTKTSFSKKNSATPYRYELKNNALEDQSKYPPFFGKISGAAQLKSTTRDLSRLFNAVKNTNDLLDEVHKSLLISPLVKRGHLEYQSLGLKISYETNLNIGHGGVNVGNTSELRYFPSSDLVLIVLCNNRSGAPNLYNFVKNNLPK